MKSHRGLVSVNVTRPAVSAGGSAPREGSVPTEIGDRGPHCEGMAFRSLRKMLLN